MNIQSPPNLSVDHVIKLINTLYSSNNPDDVAEANRSLTEIQASNNVWEICWPLLDPSQLRPAEVHFFAANTLVQKINQNWQQLDKEWLEKQLRPKLFETLVSYASSPNGGKLVVERLALALATFALHSIPTFWPDAIENILQTFTPQNLPVTISPQRICEILLKILLYIPEEYAVLVPQQEHRAKLNGQMTKSGPIVFKFLHSLLNADKSTISSDCQQNVLKCITSWTLHSRTSLLEMDDGKPLLDLLYNAIMDEELCGLACTSLASTFSSQKAENYKNAVIDFIPKIAQLKHAIDKYLFKDEIECAIKIYSLVINFSENHSKLLLNLTLDIGPESKIEKIEEIKQAIFIVIKMILDCASAPGIYGIDEKYSELSFAFWFSFFEDFYYYSESYSDKICEIFDPLVDSLLQTLITKAKYPSTATYYQSWNEDQRESYRCYRQDLGDNISLIIHFPRAKDRILERLHNQFAEELSRMVQSNPTDGELPWQGFEAVVFALKSVAEAVPYDEATYVPKIFNLLSQIPFNESQVLLYCTVAEMISAYSDWLYTHNTHLAIAFNILFLGVGSSNSQVRLMSTLSLKDLTTECQSVLHPFAMKIVESCTDAILRLNLNLSTNEKSRLMHTIGTTLVVLPADKITPALNTLTTPLLCDLGAKAQGDPTVDVNCRPIIYDRLAMLNSLIESLYVKQYSGSDYDEGDENSYRPTMSQLDDPDSEITQPSIGLLRQMIPILKLVASKYQADEDIMKIISNTIKRSAKSLGIEVEPVLKDLLTIIVESYDPMLNSNILDGSLPLYMLFKTNYNTHTDNQDIQTFLRDAFGRISDKTLEACIGNPLRQMSMTIENYFKFATFVCKKFKEFFTIPSTVVKAEYIFKLAVASLELPEKRTLNEVCNFLNQFQSKSIGVDHMYSIVVNHLDVLLNKIFCILGGNYATPRNAIECVVDLLDTVTEMEESKQHLKAIVNTDKFPTAFVSREQKAEFVTRIVHEKNRRKFKEICSDFVLLVRNLNRLI